MPLREPVSDPVLSALEWLAGEPDAAPAADLATLRTHLARLPAELGADEPARQCLEQLAARAADIGERFKSHLLDAALPLPPALGGAASALVSAMLDVAGRFRSVAHMRRAGGHPAHALAASGLRLVDDAFLIAAMSGASPPAGLWRCGRGLFAVADGGADAGAAARHFRRLLALAALQPETLVAREIAWCHEYLDAGAAAVVVADAPLEPAASAYWLDPDADAGPVAAVRRAPDGSAALVHFSTHALARQAGEDADALRERLARAEAAGQDRGALSLEPGAHLPVGLTPAEALSLLERVRDRWGSPTSRAEPRQAHDYTVEICIGLRAIRDAVRAGMNAPRGAEWTVCNESAGGYAVIAAGGAEGALSAGMPVGLRRGAGEPWSICLVRWIRSEGPGAAELGLQRIASTCTPVTVGFHGGEVRAATPALILPPLPASRANPAILAPSGTYTSRGFALAHDAEPLRVEQARVLRLGMQNANVELFEYEIGPYPG